MSLRAVAVGILMLAPLAAAADDGTAHGNGKNAGYTDRIIVKYRAAGAGTAAARDGGAGTTLSAQRFGVSMNRLRTTALGSQVLKVDRRLTLAEAEQLAADIAASDPDVEYAEPAR